VARRVAVAAAVAATALSPAAPVGASAAAPGLRVSTVARGLEIPWELAFLPDGRALVTERPGRVRLLGRDGRLRRRPVARVAVSALGEGGLLGLALDPAFARNRFVYLYFTAEGRMQLERRRLTRGRLVRERSLLEGILAGSVHDSGRIAFGPDRRLYVSTGDAGQPQLAQDPSSLNGKFLALAPAQYRGSGVARPEIVSSGHRNAQGFDWEPGTGRAASTAQRGGTRST
jgi:glucose/arabinose dehydrogenase